jgi:hypothetical protein
MAMVRVRNGGIAEDRAVRDADAQFGRRMTSPRKLPFVVYRRPFGVLLDFFCARVFAGSGIAGALWTIGAMSGAVVESSRSVRDAEWVAALRAAETAVGGVDVCLW